LFAGGIELLLFILPSLISGKMIKGVRIGGNGPALSYLDTLEVPIIDNTPNEEDLKDSMKEAMEKYPSAAGILVLRHGLYVWGMSSASHLGFYVSNPSIRR
jgi:ribulose-5-phosphate 4-epimerase/fuculose-1-phosphate aldolase